MHPRAGFAIACLASCLATGCGTSPPSRFYALAATSAPTSATSSLVVAVGPVTVPSVVDRPEIVVQTGPNEVRIDDFNRWASPLQDNLTRALADNLSADLGTPRVIRFPQPIAIEPDYRVVVEVRTFQSEPGVAATLDAIWTVRRTKDGKTQTGRTAVREPVAEKGYDALAAAHSRAVARASRDIADAILALQRGT